MIRQRLASLKARIARLEGKKQGFYLNSTN